MKELSIEEKAKRYDEAIERAKKWYDANTNEGYRGIFEDIFPELKESEDETVRKALIKYFTSRISNLYGVPFKEVVTWLEKQGNPTVIIPKFRVGDEIKISNEESLTITKIDEKGYWSEDLFICNFDDADKWKLIEQKSAWSEEDDKILKSIIINIENLQFSEDMREKYHHILNANKSYYQIKIDWLESLKDRVQPQPKQVLDFLDKLRTPKDKVQPKQ